MNIIVYEHQVLLVRYYDHDRCTNLMVNTTIKRCGVVIIILQDIHTFALKMVVEVAVIYIVVQYQKNFNQKQTNPN